MKKLIFVCSPFQGKQENLIKAREYCKLVMAAGFIPIAPHLIYPQFLDDHDKAQRNAGLEAGLLLLRKCDELWYWGEETEGMTKEIELSALLKIPIFRQEKQCRTQKRSKKRL